MAYDDMYRSQRVTAAATFRKKNIGTARLQHVNGELLVTSRPSERLDVGDLSNAVANPAWRRSQTLRIVSDTNGRNKLDGGNAALPLGFVEVVGSNAKHMEWHHVLPTLLLWLPDLTTIYARNAQWAKTAFSFEEVTPDSATATLQTIQIEKLKLPTGNPGRPSQSMRTLVLSGARLPSYDAPRFAVGIAAMMPNLTEVRLDALHMPANEGRHTRVAEIVVVLLNNLARLTTLYVGLADPKTHKRFTPEWAKSTVDAGHVWHWPRDAKSDTLTKLWLNWCNWRELKLSNGFPALLQIMSISTNVDLKSDDFVVENAVLAHAVNPSDDAVAAAIHGDAAQTEAYDVKPEQEPLGIVAVADDEDKRFLGARITEGKYWTADTLKISSVWRVDVKITETDKDKPVLLEKQEQKYPDEGVVKFTNVNHGGKLFRPATRARVLDVWRADRASVVVPWNLLIE